MLLLRKVLVCCGICVLACQLNACANAVFPDFADEEEIRVGEGGRVLDSSYKESSSLKADVEHVAYENEPEKNVTKKPEPVPAKESENLKDILAAQEAEAAQDVEAAKTIPVKTAEIELPAAEEPAAAEAAKQEVVLETPAEQNVGPSVSYRLDTFYFDNGSSALDSKYNASIRKIVKTAKANNANLIVYGYASSRTRNTDPITHKVANFKISYARAQSVVAALRRAGMPADRITSEALADTAPAYQEVMPEGERLNRRAEVYISY